MKKLLLSILVLTVFISCNKKNEEFEKIKRDAEIEQIVEEKLNEKAEQKKEEEKTAKNSDSLTDIKSKTSKGTYKEKLLIRTRDVQKQYKELVKDTENSYDHVDEINDLGSKWDIELNKVYQLLMNELSSNQKQELKIKQRSWIKERDKEINATGDRLVQSDLFYNLTKERTLELATLYDEL